MSTNDEWFKVLRSATRYIPFHLSISPSSINHTVVHSDTHTTSNAAFTQPVSAVLKAQRFPGCALASSRSSSSLGLSMTGVGGLCADMVKLDVAPGTSPYSRTGELIISSRDGIGRLRIVRDVRTKEEGGVTRERPDDGNSPILSTDLSRRSCLCAYLFSERTHFFDDQLLHPLDRVFLFK